MMTGKTRESCAIHNLSFSFFAEVVSLTHRQTGKRTDTQPDYQTMSG